MRCGFWPLIHSKQHLCSSQILVPHLIFRKWVRRMLLNFASLISGCFWPASTLLRGHIVLAIPSPPETVNFWSIGVTLLRITWANYSKRWILVSNVSMTYDGLGELNTSDWFPYVWALSQNRWRLSSTFQHSHCTFVTILFGPFARLFNNLTKCIRALFPKICILLLTCRTSILEDAISHRVIWCKFLWRNPCKSHRYILPLGLFPLGLPRERTRRRIRLCHLFTLFCSMILDHGVSFIISVSGFKILHSQILLDTSFRHRLQSVIIRSCFLLMSLQVVQFQNGLEFFRLSYSKFVQAFLDVIRWDLCHQK